MWHIHKWGPWQSMEAEYLNPLTQKTWTELVQVRNCKDPKCKQLKIRKIRE